MWGLTWLLGPKLLQGRLENEAPRLDELHVTIESVFCPVPFFMKVERSSSNGGGKTVGYYLFTPWRAYTLSETPV